MGWAKAELWQQKSCQGCHSRQRHPGKRGRAKWCALRHIGLIRLFIQGQEYTCYASIMDQMWCSFWDLTSQTVPPRWVAGGGDRTRQKWLQSRQGVLAEGLGTHQKLLSDTSNNLISLRNPLRICHQGLLESLA